MNIFDFKRLKASKQKVFTGMIEADGVAMCVHYRRLKADPPGPFPISPVTNRAENDQADSATQEVQENEFVVGADPENATTITNAVPKRAEYGINGNFFQRDMRLLRFSRARYYRESGFTSARKRIEKWNPGTKQHLEAIRDVTSRGADFRAFREFIKTRVAHGNALWKEYTMPRRARPRLNLYCGKQRAFANFLNELSALKGDESQRLVVAYGAGRWGSKKESTPAATPRTYPECARRFVTVPIDEFRASFIHQELRCTLQRVEMQKCQRNPEVI
jgi:hypothetical protein